MCVLICIECSHKRGMGHFYRQLNLFNALTEKGLKCVILVNNDAKTVELLKTKGIQYEIVDLWDYDTNWETALVKKYNAVAWINDRMNTDSRHVENVRLNEILVFTFDDCGTGANLSDVNFAPMVMKSLESANVFQDIDYLILNKEIDKYKGLRHKVDKIIISLGGSDTYGVTLEVIKILKTLGKTATVICGKCFEQTEELYQICKGDFNVINDVPSLIEEFTKHDLAITGGGVTAFEAAALGLPAVIVASEFHEVEIGEYLHDLGSALYAGFRDNIDTDVIRYAFEMTSSEIKKMSDCGLKHIKTSGIDNITSMIMERIR